MESPGEHSLDRSLAPTPGAIRPFHLPSISTHASENGLVVRSMARASVPLVSVCLVLDAGEAGVPGTHAGMAVLAGDALQGGTAVRSGADLAEALEGLGSAIRVSTGWDATTLSFTCLAERLEEMFSLLAEVVRTPAFPPDEVDRVRLQRLAAIRQRRMDPGSLADDEFDREVFDPGHPFHRPLGGSESTVAHLDDAALRAFAMRRHGPARGGLVVVGDLSPDRVNEAAERHFGTWMDSGSDRVDLAPASEAEGCRVVLIRRPGAVQSEIRIGHVGPPRVTPDEIELRVVNVVLGGAFSSRLNMSLRERRGFTYGVHSHFSFRRGGGAFTIETAVQTEVTAPALSEAMAVFRGFAEEGPSPEEVDRARDYLAGVFPLRMETTAQLAGQLAELIVFGLPDDYHHDYRDRIRQVEPERARAVVGRHFRPDRSTIVVVGDADRIAGEVEALGIGPVEVRDP